MFSPERVSSRWQVSVLLNLETNCLKMPAEGAGELLGVVFSTDGKHARDVQHP